MPAEWHWHLRRVCATLHASDCFLTLPLQGLALGGEFSAAVCYVSELAAPGRRVVWTACLQVHAVLRGILWWMVGWLAGRRAGGHRPLASWLAGQFIG